MINNIEVLISCMYQNAKDIINRTNIQTDVLVINQCDEDKYEEFSFVNKQKVKCKARIFYTRERGLSRSRNMALKNAKGNILLICDDDEFLVDSYERIILDAFKSYSENDILAFKLSHPTKKYMNKSYVIGYLKAAKLSSWQLAIKNNEKLKSVKFCEIMGSGTGNGAGEENKFIIDCLKNKFIIRYVPLLIGKVAQTNSMWFHGYTKKYWQDKGWVSKMIYGYIWGYIYIWYTFIFKSWKLDKKHSCISVLYWMHQGYCENRM